MWRKAFLTAFLMSLIGIALACESVTHAGDYSTAVTAVDNCAPGTLFCNGSCVPEDSSNCGKCNVKCETGQVCSGGVCGSQCTGGTTQCSNNACVDTQNDPANCGRCGGPVDGGTCIVCQAGKCRNDCLKPATLCHSRCVDFDNDPDNCGSCGHACGAGLFCSNGNCGASCGPDETQCPGNTCINTATDPNHCGGGGCNAQACPAPDSNGEAVCVGGNCEVACDVGYTHCNGAIGPGGGGTSGGTACANLLNDSEHCGACENNCANTQQVCVLGRCTSGK